MRLETVLATIELCASFTCLVALLYRVMIRKTTDRLNIVLNGVLICDTILFATDFITWYIIFEPGLLVHNTLLLMSVVFYTLDYILLLLFLYYVGIQCPKNTFNFVLYRIGEIALTVELILAFVSMKTGWFYYISDNNGLERGPWFMASQVISILMFLLVLLMILGNLKTLKDRAISCFFYLLFPLIASVLQALGIFQLNLAIVDFGIISTTVLMLMIELEEDYHKREYQQRMIENQMSMIRNQQKEIADLRVTAVLSQIQPHFIFNVLNIIYYLCETDPVKAQQAVDQFSDYLRTNIDSLSTKELVPFSQELRHVKNYISLEKMRYDEDLTVQYDIEAEDFYLPVLTVQPLVENAIKHGIAKSENPGVVTIRTVEDDKNYYIYIVDNGVGFDPNEEKNDGRQHVGIENVRSRLESRCDASLDLFTQLGVGTTSVITIPKKTGTEDKDALNQMDLE